MRPSRPTVGVPATALFLVSLFLSSGCIPPGGAAHDGTTPRMEGQRLAETTAQGETRGESSRGKILSASIPARDAPGKPVPGLPRHPGSVRVGYSEKGVEGLTLVRTSYLTREEPEAVRGFYRGVFRTQAWQVANVDYSGDGWHFLVVRGDLEAWVEVLPRDGGSEVKVELSGPAQESGASAGGSKR